MKKPSRNKIYFLLLREQLLLSLSVISVWHCSEEEEWYIVNTMTKRSGKYRKQEQETMIDCCVTITWRMCMLLNSGAIQCIYISSSIILSVSDLCIFLQTSCSFRNTISKILFIWSDISCKDFQLSVTESFLLESLMHNMHQQQRDCDLP